MGKAFGRRFAIESVVLGLVVGGFNPSPVPAIEFIEGVDGLKEERGQELGLGPEKISLYFSLGMGRELHPIQRNRSSFSPLRIPIIRGEVGALS